MPVSAGAGKIPVLMYHALYREAADLEGRPAAEVRYWVQVDAFARQIGLLQESGWTAVRLEDLLPGAGPVPSGKAVIITFDDGWRSDVTLALPILQRAGWSAEHFVTAGWTGTPDFLSREDLVALDRAGMGIHSHSLTHPDFDRLGRDRWQGELAGSKARLEDILGHSIGFLSLPGGTGAGRVMGRLAKACGYKGICTSKVGLQERTADPYSIRRIPVTRGAGPERVLEWAQGVGIARLRWSRGLFGIARGVLGARLYEDLKAWTIRQRGKGT